MRGSLIALTKHATCKLNLKYGFIPNKSVTRYSEISRIFFGVLIIYILPPGFCAVKYYP